jgi:hypothetical protein
MRMNASERSDLLWAIDHITERCGKPSVDSTLQQPCSNEQAPPRNPLEPWASDEGACETFVGGTGI